MSLQDTYTHLFRNYRQVLAQGAAPRIDELREAAFARFEREGLPRPDSEEYRYCRLDEALSVDYGMNLFRMGVPAHPGDVFRCDVPTLSTCLYFVVNDLFYPPKKPAVLPEGVLAGSLNQLLKEHPDLLASFYGRLSEKSADGMAAMNTAFAQDGFLLYVPKGVKVERPIQLIQMFQGEIDILSTRRLLVVLEEGASASLIVCDHAITSSRYFSNQVSEIWLGENSRLEYYEMEMTHDKTVRVANTFLSLASGADMLMNYTGLENGQTRNNVHLSFEGENARADLSGLYLLSRSQQTDNHVTVDHTVGSCQSQQLFKYVLDDQAQGVFGGKVLVRPGAQHTSALQSNANMCGSHQARMHAMPQLEIYADDVKCSHGSATGRIDENALFYMRQRGLDPDEARRLLKFAFISDVVERIGLRPLQDRVRMLAAKRFRGELAKCIDCKICS